MYLYVYTMKRCLLLKRRRLYARILHLKRVHHLNSQTWPTYMRMYSKQKNPPILAPKYIIMHIFECIRKYACFSTPRVIGGMFVLIGETGQELAAMFFLSCV